MLGLARHGARRRPRIALVLGSGGIRTVCHIGLFKALRREGIPIDLVVGSSGGSLFGAAFALGTEPDRIEYWVQRCWRRELFRDYGYAQLFKMLSPRLLRFDENFGILRGDAVRRTLARLFGRLRFEDTDIPLRVVATDLHDGSAVVLSEGSLIEAIRASISIPVLFQPYRIGGRWLVDGALCSPLPIEHAIDEGAEVIISMGFPSQLHPRIDGPLRLVTQIMRISGNRLYRAELAYHARNPRIEVVPVEVHCDSHVGMRDVHEIPSLIQAGEEAADAKMDFIKRTIAGFHSPRNRAKRRLRQHVGRALRTSITDLPRYDVGIG
jgi:NTE family protein